AIQSKRADLVQMMMKEAWPPADVDSTTPDGTTALAYAEHLGAREIAAMLRAAGASDWAQAEMVLGKRTSFSFDTRRAPLAS
ncbi:unnamed protein product, partial [Polarella glacialis]